HCPLLSRPRSVLPTPRSSDLTFGNGPDAAGKALVRPGGGLLCRIRRDPFTFEDVWSSEVIVPSFQERRSDLTRPDVLEREWISADRKRTHPRSSHVSRSQPAS